jgi:hypothetical protein
MQKVRKQRWKFHGGPLAGRAVLASPEMVIPGELIFREVEVAPWRDCIYRLRILATISVGSSGVIVSDFDYVGQSQILRVADFCKKQIAWRDEEILRMKEKLKRQTKWINILRGRIKAAKTRKAKKR